MEDSYKIIKSILRKAQEWLLLKAVFQNISFGICVAFILGLFVQLLSRLIPIYKVYVICIWIGVVVITLAIISAFITSPKLKKVANKIDSLGLQERVTTALELKEGESIYKELLVGDAAERLEKLNYKVKIPLLPHKNYLLVIILLGILFCGAMLLPDPLSSRAEELHEINTYKSQQEEKIVKAEKEVNENKIITEAEKKEILAELEALKKEVQLAENNKEVDKAVDKTAKKLEQEVLPQEVKKLSEKLSENTDTKKLAEAIKSGQLEDIQKQLDALKDASKSMDAAAKTSLKNTLAKASSDMKEGELKDSIDGLNSALSSGDDKAITKSVDSVKGAVKSGLSQQSMNNALAQAQSNLQSTQNTSAAGQGTGQGSGTSQGTGQGSGSGAGTGQGQGSGGSGAGSESGNGDGGVTPYSSSGGIANKVPSTGAPKEYEKVFTPSSLGGQGETSQLTGKSNGNSGSSESAISDDSNATLGQLTPYNQVAGEYSKKAMENMNNSGIPSGMEDIVKGYFSSLTD